MTLIASLLFVIALFGSVYVIMVTVRNSLPRIKGVVEVEFGPSIQIERQINFGLVKQRKPTRFADVVAFPVMARTETDFKMAA